jgi:hypothetical protein
MAPHQQNHHQNRQGAKVNGFEKLRGLKTSFVD